MAFVLERSLETEPRLKHKKKRRGELRMKFYLLPWMIHKVHPFKDVTLSEEIRDLLFEVVFNEGEIALKFFLVDFSVKEYGLTDWGR